MFFVLHIIHDTDLFNNHVLSSYDTRTNEIDANYSIYHYYSSMEPSNYTEYNSL